MNNDVIYSIDIIENEMNLIERYNYELNGEKVRLLQFIHECKFPISYDLYENCMYNYITSYIRSSLFNSYILNKYITNKDYTKDYYFNHDLVCIDVKNSACTSCKI